MEQLVQSSISFGKSLSPECLSPSCFIEIFFRKARKNMFIHLRKEQFDLFLFQGGQLLVQNSFPQKNADEFMYYLFYVCEQFYLKPEQFDLFFLGQYFPYSDYYNGTKEFHPNCSHLDPISPQWTPTTLHHSCKVFVPNENHFWNI